MDEPIPMPPAPSGIQLDGPPPGDEFSDLKPPSAAVTHDNPFADLVPAGGKLAISKNNPFADLVPKKKDDSASMGDLSAAFTGPINKVVMAPVRAGAYLGNKAMDAMGMPETNDVEDQLKQNFWPDYKDTTGTRMAHAAGQAVPDTAAIMGTVGEAAPQILATKLGPGAQKVAGPILGAIQDTIKAYGKNPSSIMRDLAVATPLAGAGGELGKEETKGTPYEDLGEMAGAVGGATMTGAPALAGKYWKYGIYPNLVKLPFNIAKGAALSNMPDSFTEGDGAASSILKGMKDRYTDQLNKKALPQAAKLFKQTMTPDAMGAMQDAQQLKQTIPGFNPSLAESTGIPSLMATQKGVEAGSSGNALDQFVARKNASQQGIENYAAQQAPQDSGAGISGAVQRRVDQAGAPVGRQLDSVATAQEDLAGTLPKASPYDVGSGMRERLEDLRTTKQGEMSKLADDMGLNDAKGLRVSSAAIQNAVKSALPSKLASGASPTLRSITKMDPSDPLQFKDAQYLMESLGGDARMLAKQGDAHGAKIVTDARNGIDDYLKNDWAPALNIGDKYGAFRDRYLNEYIKPYEQGAAKTVKSLGADTQYRTDNEDVASKFWKPGDQTAAQDFNKTFQGDPGATSAMQAHILDDLRQTAVKDGAIDPAKMDKWMTANDANLSQFPSIKSDLMSKQKLAQQLSDRQATLMDRQQTVQDSSLNKMLQDNNVTMEGLLADKNSFGRVVKAATPDEKQAMARRLWDTAANKGADDPASMKTFLTENADVLPKLLTKDHVNALNDIQKAWEMDARASTPTGTAVNPEMAGINLKGLTGSSPQQMLSRAFAVQSGRTGLKYTIGDLVARAGLNLKSRQAQAMIDRAMYDGDFAQQLADFVKTQNVKPEKLSKMKAYLWNSGISSMQDQANDQPDNNAAAKVTVHPNDRNLPGPDEGIMNNFSGDRQ